MAQIKREPKEFFYQVKQTLEQNIFKKTFQARAEITSNTKEIQKVVREYYEHLDAKKLDNLE